MSLPSDVTVNNLKDFYAMILPYLNVGNGGTSDTPLGQVAFFDDVVAPAGWLIADGTIYNIADYPDLANQYERVHGSKNFYGGNGTTTFAVPDWQGEFLRASGTNSHANQGSGAAVGVHQDGTLHPNVYGGVSSGGFFAPDSHTVDNADNFVGNTSTSASNFRYTTQRTTEDSKDTYTSRPTNTSLLLCIKAVPSSEMNTYSTTERRVGTWIDGKPIYQKVVDLHSITPTVTGTVVATNVDEVIDYKAKRTNSSNYYVLFDGQGDNNGIGLKLNNGTLSICSWSSNYNYSNIDWAIICYTKTTD